MGLIIAIPRETADHERRVAASPDTVRKYVALGCTVRVQTGAGDLSSMLDRDYESAGAILMKNTGDLFQNADIILCVQPPAQLDGLKPGVVLAGILSPYHNAARLADFARAGVVALAMDLVPRITRAQAMDVLSSQSNLAGYKAVLDATEYFNRAFPMMMTAAGTVPPARAFIMGVGVAGLQAIATAKRLGAIVSATDVRAATREQVQSLGGTFVMVDDDESKAAETSGGYAREMSDAYKAKQAALVAETIAKQDIVITTALIPGRKAPVLVTADMVQSMKPGSVIVDLAAEAGGNCALTDPGKVVVKHGVHIIGHYNVPSRLAANASALYAKNLLNLLGLMIDKDGGLTMPWDDDIIKGIALTRDGTIIHPNFNGEKAA